MTTELQKLEAAVATAKNAVTERTQERDDYIRFRKDELRKLLDEELAKMFSNVTALHIAHERAVTARDAEADRLAKSGGITPTAPLGKYVRWDHPRDWNGSRLRSKSAFATQDVAVVELFTLESTHRIPEYRDQPRIGSTVLRPLKKDGKPGLACVLVNPPMPKGYSIPNPWNGRYIDVYGVAGVTGGEWYPEGVDATKAKS